MIKMNWTLKFLVLMALSYSMVTYAQEDEDSGTSPSQLVPVVTTLQQVSNGHGITTVQNSPECPEEVSLNLDSIFSGLLYNVITHSTSMKNFARILKSREIRPFDKIEGKQVKKAVDFANSSVVYTQLLPDWMIRPAISEYSDVPEEVYIEFSLDLLKSRKDWRLGHDWNYGFLEGTWGLDNLEKVAEILNRKNDKAMNSFNYILNVHGMVKEAAIKTIQTSASHRLISYLLQNEVLFKDPIKLDEVEFKAYFPNSKALRYFLIKNEDILNQWDLEVDHGESIENENGHYPYLRFKKKADQSDNDR